MKVFTRVAMLGFPSCSVVDVDDADGESLIAAGFAERVAPSKVSAPVVETADAPAVVETADVAPVRKAPARKARAPKSDA